MDLTNGWDFRLETSRTKAWNYIKKFKPRLIIGSPMCTMFSSLQNFTPWGEKKKQRWIEAEAHMNFMIEIYEVRHHRFFLHEHPSRATSWTLEKMQTLLARKGVLTTTADQCMYGLETWAKDGSIMAAKKETKIATNSP